MPRLCSELSILDPVLGAVRILTTHLEYYSATQRRAQAAAVCTLHRQACERAAAPPPAGVDGTPFRARTHTPHALLCGDFNLTPGGPEYPLFADAGLHDAWPLLHPGAAHAPTFELFDRSHGGQPMACDFVFVSDSLVPRLRRIDVDATTRASDHQPVTVSVD
jgi:endonuclease/exonuclease/phosphatase family metal-dependent hydrolase